jgi:hypothetical protein
MSFPFPTHLPVVLGSPVTQCPEFSIVIDLAIKNHEQCGIILRRERDIQDERSDDKNEPQETRFT